MSESLSSSPGKARQDGRVTNEAQLVEIYESVRNLPYDTAAAHDAASLREQGRGNCVAKAGLLAEELSDVGVECRRISWEYKLPVLVDVQHELSFDSDVHTAVQVLLSGKWILVDATHDPALAALGLAVGHWDGASATEPAYQALGSILPHGHDGLLRDLDEAIERIGEQVEATDPELIVRYQHDLNQLFERARSRATSEGTMPAGR
ncbi:hypothetical protein CIK66_12965 [Brachybacterium alimentarium]|uniref:Transglutaminase-like domain-containing protein n=1 Tax=Brachybacterium alimentarium TaxID=47845 RepID=A0A2A3YI99_9MICO|nr:transglutaminase domain-containing protein [Brachybacterium alimentarium]PCC38825.1 hypothetical protein CIK66_12965 [Brachybacterium alimentarium]